MSCSPCFEGVSEVLLEILFVLTTRPTFPNTNRSSFSGNSNFPRSYLRGHSPSNASKRRNRPVFMVDYSKWDNLDVSSSDDDSKKVERAVQKKPETGLRDQALMDHSKQMKIVKGEHEKPLNHAPEFSFKEVEEDFSLKNTEKESEDGQQQQAAASKPSAVVDFWKQQMTQPQRMMLLSRWWNACDEQQRKAALTRLIDITDTAVSNRIKGGAEILRPVDISAFQSVTYPEQWLEVFQTAAEKQRVAAFEFVYSKLATDEKNNILASLSR